MPRNRDHEMGRKERDVPMHVMNKITLPKKVRSAYIFYCLKHRSRVQDEHREFSPVDVSRRLGEEWNALSPEEKEVGMKVIFLNF